MAKDRRERRSSEISPANLALASFGSLVATFLLARLGIAGTLIGAALTPILITLAQELVRRPIRRVRQKATAVVDTPGAAPRDRPSIGSRVGRLARLVSWRSVLVTSGLAFAIVVAVFTIADFAAGDSVVADRPSTFFPSRPRQPRQPAETDTGETQTEPVETREAPAETVTETTPATTSTTGATTTGATTTGATTTEPAPTVTQPPATETSP